MAITAADGQRLVEAAAVRDVPLTVFHNRRYDGDFLTLRQLLADRALGEVHRFESRFERWRPVARPDAWREHLPSEAGGGLLLDLGSHLVDQALQLFGPPRCVYAEIDVRRPGVRGDDDVFVALEHRHGVRSHLWASTVAASRDPASGFSDRALPSSSSASTVRRQPCDRVASPMIRSSASRARPGSFTVATVTPARPRPYRPAGASTYASTPRWRPLFGGRVRCP
jgi:hypothetical protein